MQSDPALRVALLALLGVVACRGPESFDPRAFPIGAGGGAVDTAPHDVLPVSADGTGGSAAGTGGAGPDRIEQTGGAGGDVDGAVTIPDQPDAAVDQPEREAAGTDGSPDGGDDALADPCPRAAWTATALRSQPGRPARNAIDGVLNTFWSTGANQDGNDWFRVNLGGVFKLSRIKLNNTVGFPADYPGAYAVFSSLDGVTFKGPLVTGRGAPGLTDIPFPQEPMRYFEIRQTGITHAGNWWQIGEVTVDCLP
jgi:hypothetical protein